MTLLEYSPESAAAMLRGAGVKSSHQRVKVLDYLLAHRTHPTVETIHRALLPEMSTLSKTTVYNTLDVLMDAGLVRIVHIEDNETRYDIQTSEHGHFKCEKCGAIHDFHVDMAPLTVDMPAGFRIRERNVYVRGVCARCLEKEASCD